MEIKNKDYKITETKTYLKINTLFFVFNGISRNSNNWLNVEQELKTLGYKPYKILNKITKKTLNSSIYFKIKPIINGSTFFIKPINTQCKIDKDIFLRSFEPLLFIILAIKINNKMYSANQIKTLRSLSYKENKLIIQQFIVTHMKTYYK